MKKCKECSKEFSHPDKRTKFCTDSCRGTNSARVYRERNRDKETARGKLNYLKSVSNDTYVYKLVCGYVGVSHNLKYRMQKHREHNRITNGYTILANCPTREEALDLEALYQSINNLTVDSKSRLRFK